MKLRSITTKNKKGISSIIGYVLLITFGLIMAVIGYNYLKTYVPRDMIECPDGTSIFIKDYECNSTTLEITIKNNGKFNYAGYYIHAANTTEQEVATINLANNFEKDIENEATNISGTHIMFSPDENKMIPKREVTHIFTLDNNIEILELTPVRFQKEGSTRRFVSCSGMKTREEVECS